MKKIAATILAAIALSSCGNGKKFMPTVTGSTFDMVVVGDKQVWDDTTGQRLNEMLTDAVPGLPEIEDNFKVIYIQPSMFDNVLKPARNILFYDINPEKYTKGSIVYEMDKWATIQAVATINAPDNETFVNTLKQHRQEIMRYFNAAEEKRAVSFYHSYQNHEFIMNLKDKFGIEMLVPANITKKKEVDGFVWMSNGNPDMMENIVVYSQPYTSEDQFLASHILSVQDSLTKKHIPGSVDGSYMRHEGRVEPACEFIKTDYSEYCIEVKGLWCTEGDDMGGPYVSRNYLSPDHKRIVTAMAFLYGPGHDKRNKMSMLEGALGTLKFADTEESKATGEAEK